MQDEEFNRGEGGRASVKCYMIAGPTREKVYLILGLQWDRTKSLEWILTRQIK